MILNNVLKSTGRTIASYFERNKLFLSYIFLSLVGTIILRYFTIGNIFNIKPLLVDLAFIILIGSFGLFIKTKKQFTYLLICMLIFTIDEFINHIYYLFYTSFASFGELAGLGQAETVTGAILYKFTIWNFIYFFIPLFFYLIHKFLLKKSYYDKLAFKRRSNFIVSIFVGTSLLIYSFATAIESDYTALAKQWNRLAIVERFGIIMYQGNDLIKTLTPKINSLFGYEKSINKFKEFFETETKYNEDNEYTNIFEGYNLIYVHMESIQTFLMDLIFNGEEVTPTINKLKNEGMFFENFYPQVSSGTSSDTEFTSLTSLLPVSSGIVFTSYYKQDYITVPKLLSNKGYFTFSMHGNYSSMWNRDNVHPRLGYQKMYFRDNFDIPDENSSEYINLGISDKEFFKQAIPKLEEIEKNNEKYMGYVITLSNHLPFVYLDKYGDYDLSITTKDENGNTITSSYLNDTIVGNYIKSAHYADVALGYFIDEIKSSDKFENTIFVFYGDHDAKLSRSEINDLYNTNPLTNELYDYTDSLYYDYNSFLHELNKKTPLIIWSKDKDIQKKINKVVSYPMGMVDLMPTLGNMFGFSNKYALGHDIFNIKNDNIVLFPNGNFLTDILYYSNSSLSYYPLKSGINIEDDYIEKCQQYLSERLDISDYIIMYNLLQNADGMKEKNKDE